MIKKWFLRIFSAGFVRSGKILFEAAFAVAAVIALWCFGAFFRAFDLPTFVSLGAVVVLLGSLIASLFFRWALIAAVLLETVTVLSYQSLSPEQRFSKTVWQQSWRRILDVRKLDDDRYELCNVRDFLYRSENDYDVRYRDLTVSLEQLSSVDIAFSHWDNLEEIAHSMLGLNFTDGTTVVISLETRLPEGASQNALDGFYRRYELAMIAGTPEDLYGLRADHRGETLYVYRIQADPENLRDLAVSIFEQAAKLQRKPEYYNSLFRNCTTGMMPLLLGRLRNLQGDYRVMLNGLAAQLFYEKDLLAHRDDESFGALRARSLVPGICRGKNAPSAHYCGESEARWLRNR